jgi:hypothetical protein
MRVEGWFALALRIVGIVLLVIPGLLTLLDSLMLKLGYFNLPDTQPSYYLIYGTVQVVVGLYLSRGAPFLVELAYPRGDEDEVGAEDEAEQNKV